MLHVDEKALEEDPGFKEDNWPAMGDAKWAKHTKSKGSQTRQRQLLQPQQQN